MNKIIPYIGLTAILLLSGCASTPGTGQRILLDSLGTGIGGSAAYYGGNGDPALTTAGAVGGFVVTEAIQAIAKTGRKKAYNSGIEEGKAMGQEQILQGLWEESNGLPKGKQNPLTFPLMIPQRIQNGVLYDKHSFTPNTAIPTKILIPAISNTNATYHPHYESIPEEK